MHITLNEKIQKQKKPQQSYTWTQLFLYFILSTEELSGYLHFDRFETKDQISDGVKTIIKAELESGHPVKNIVVDNGTEYRNSNLNSMLSKRGIVHDFSTAYTPEQNGRAERFNRTILNGIKTLLYDSGLQEDLWEEALNTVVYTTNRIPSSKKPDKNRYELFRNDKPDLSNLRIFGQPVVIKEGERWKICSTRSQRYLCWLSRSLQHLLDLPQWTFPTRY